MIDKSSEAINSFYSYLRAVLDNPDVIETKTLEAEASNYLNRNPHVKDNIDFHSLVGGIKERIDVVETIDFGITQMLDDKTVDHQDWYEDYLDKESNNRPYWQRYYNYFLSTGLSSVVLKGVDTSTDQILSKCEDPNRPGKWSNKGLVVGVVQGGKTTNMIGLCNKAIDAGYRLIIVIPGLLEDLRLQTHERFDAGLIGLDTQSNLDQEIRTFSHGVSNYNRKINVHTFTTANKKGDSLNDLKKLVIKDNKEPSIVIIKKNTNVLHNLIETIDRKEQAFKNVPVLIIDDESDLASINTKTIQNIEKVTRDEITKTPLYIRALLSLFDKSVYIGYTATPYANIFQHYREKAEKESTLLLKRKDRYQNVKEVKKTFNLGEGLFPKNFICSLPVYSNYIGFEKMFGDNFFEDGHYLGNRAIKTVSDYVDTSSYERLDTYYSNLDLPNQSRTNPKPDRSEINGWMSPLHESDWAPKNFFDIPESLKEAICFFIISNIVKKLRKINPIHNSMLINVSRFKDTNESVSTQVQDYLNDITTKFALGDNDSKIKDKLRSIWKNDFGGKINDKYMYPPRKIIWDEIENLIPNELRKIQTLLITGDNDYLNYSKYKSVSVIAVGGTKLSRGITLEGLSVSYFLRKSVTSSADSVTQMGRWFGYRPRYEDVCRLYLTEFLLDDFREYYEAEEDLRNQLFSMDRKGLTPTEFGLMIKMKRPAASNRMRFTERHRIDRNFSGKLKQLIFINIKKNKENIEATKAMFNKLQLLNKPTISNDNSRYWQNIDSKIVEDFLNAYKSPLSYSRFTEDAYSNYINTCNSIGDELKNWNIAVVSNKNGKKVNKDLIGVDFIPKTREYDAKVVKNKAGLEEWNGNPKLLNDFDGEDHDTYRISVLTERSHLYLDMNLTKKDAEDLINKEKEAHKVIKKEFKEAVYWRKKRKKPILIIYPFKSPRDDENDFIYISYAIIFPFSKIVQENHHRFSPSWETLNPVLVDQLESFRKIEART